MKPNAKPRNQSLLIGILIAVAIVILFLRMLVFVAGHGRHRF